MYVETVHAGYNMKSGMYNFSSFVLFFNTVEKRQKQKQTDNEIDVLFYCTTLCTYIYIYIYSC